MSLVAHFLAGMLLLNGRCRACIISATELIANTRHEFRYSQRINISLFESLDSLSVADVMHAFQPPCDLWQSTGSCSLRQEVYAMDRSQASLGCLPLYAMASWLDVPSTIIHLC